MKKSKEFLLKFIVYSLLLPVIGLILSIFWGSMVLYLSVLLYLIIAIVTIVKAWTPVPHKWVYIVEMFGKFSNILEPGPHFVFPWFGFIKVKHKIFTGELKMALFDEEIEETEDYKGGIVDLNDESAKIKAVFFFKVRSYGDLNDEEKKYYKDQLEANGEISIGASDKEVAAKIQVYLYKTAAYQTNDPISYIKSKAEAALRSFLAQYEILEANELKTNFELNQVANMLTPDELKKEKKEEAMRREKDKAKKKKAEETKSREEEKVDTGKVKENENEWKESRFGKKLISWGFTPTSFSITEIQFPDRFIEERARLMKAKKDVKIAEQKKQESITLSEGEADALKNMSEARANEVKKIIKETNASKEEAFLFIINRQKYEALQKAGNVTWIAGADDGEVKRGGAFGAGFKS